MFSCVFLQCFTRAECQVWAMLPPVGGKHTHTHTHTRWCHSGINFAHHRRKCVFLFVWVWGCSVSMKPYLLTQLGHPTFTTMWKDKTLMALIQHTQTHTHAHAHNTHKLTQSLFPSVCLHYVMERVVRGFVDLSNLISYCGRTAYIRNSGTGWGREKSRMERKRGPEDVDVGDRFRMK